ncbi:MAG: hypothetical protein JWO31_3304, partial [Phycisphaerales bacterium]|nr:hypothetical protein [Phycisphaerales bacterium]
ATQLARAAATKAATAPTPGVATRPARPNPDEASFLTLAILTAQGEGTVQVRRADLINIGFIRYLYDLMGFFQRSKEPDGSADVAFRIENGDAFVTAFRYFYQGAEVRAVGTIQDLFLLQRANADLTAHGAIRALKSVQIPIVRSVVPDIDEILAAIQQNSVAVTVTGPLIDAKPKFLPFDALGKGMRELLAGDYNASNKQVRRPPPRQ